jgi:nitrogen regulatory protein PII
MKLITAIVQPDKLDDAMRAVTDAGARGMTVTDVRGFGQQYGHLGTTGPAGKQAFVRPKLRIDVVVHDDAAGVVTDALAKSLHTGKIGDGKIWVCPVDEALRVRTGERGRAAV